MSFAHLKEGYLKISKKITALLTIENYKRSENRSKASLPKTFITLILKIMIEMRLSSCFSFTKIRRKQGKRWRLLNGLNKVLIKS